MRGFWTKRRAVVVVTLAVVVLGFGGYIGVGSYVRENADTVTITVLGSQVTFLTTSDGTPIPERPIKPVERFHYTGSLARQIQRAINGYHDPEGRVTPECNPDSSQIYAYSYALTFTLNGVVVESATETTEECWWRLSILGFPTVLADNNKVVPDQLNSLTNGQIPTLQAPDYA